MRWIAIDFFVVYSFLYETHIESFAYFLKCSFYPSTCIYLICSLINVKWYLHVNFFFFLNMATLISQDPLSTFSFIDILTSCHAFNKHSLKIVSTDGWGHKYGEQNIFINQEGEKQLHRGYNLPSKNVSSCMAIKKEKQTNKHKYSWYRKKRVANTSISFKKRVWLTWTLIGGRISANDCCCCC